MKSTKFWVLLLSAVLVVSAAAAVMISERTAGSVIANIYQGGECIYSIDLSRVREPYTIEIEGYVENTIAVEPGRICVGHATCPDQVCVNQGWISDGALPIVCLPNRLVIEIEAVASEEIDAVTR